MYGQPEGYPVLDDDGWKWAELIEVSLDPGRDGHSEDGTCSYCGSMSPDALFAAIEAGQEITPTDKSYKVYVDSHRGKFYMHHLNRENCARLKALLDAGAVKIAYPGYFYNGLWLNRPEKPAEEDPDA